MESRTATGLRRSGLPRVSGGAPWPPPRAGAALLADPAPGPVQAPGPATHAARAVPPAELGGGTALHRRGLPRTVGGESWPPERAVPVVHAAPVPLVVALTPVVNVAPEVPEANDGPTAVAAPIGQPAEESAEIPVPAPSPRPQLRRYRGRTLRQWTGIGVLAGAAVLLFGALAMLFTRWLLGTQPLQDFLGHYPGESRLPDGAPVGVPWWLSWAHFFNVFLILLIIRSGLQTRAEKRPTVFWTPRWNPKRKISLTIWFHQALDLLWFLNGVVFVVLLFATGQWVRIVPTSWDVFPNAISAGLQYVSLDWPTENGWVNYNGLQQLAYFGTVFLAAPLAAATGVRMSGLWPKGATRLNKIYPIEVARAVHFPVMLYFVVFIAFHITLVLATGALRNLNHMYAGQDVVNWTGLGIFAVSLLVIAGGVFAARPLVIAPIASLFGRVGR
jgi:thiosulfate reductase cytochrome b subunit